MSTGTDTDQGISAPTTPEAAARLRVAVMRLYRQIRSQAADGDLSPTLLSALGAISRLGPISLGDLATHELVAPPTITKIVDQLETAGLVERTRCQDDRRVFRVAVTSAGRQYVDRIRRRRTAWLSRQVATLSDDDRQVLLGAIDILERLADESQP